jgi:hypothetical protein
VSDDIRERETPQGRPVWLRVVVQVGLAVVLSLVTPLLGVALSPLTMPVYRLGKSAGASKTGMFALIQLNGAVPYLLTGALAALLTWWIVRRAWDVLGFCGLYGAFILTLGIMMCPREPQQQPWWWPLMVASEILSLCLGAVVVALLLQRRKRPVEVRRTDEAAFLP